MEWRNMNKIGSLLGDYEDMRRRMQLSNNTMESMNEIWPQHLFIFYFNFIFPRINIKIYKTEK